MKKTKQILPGATIGILGEGQLGQMLALQARKMGYNVIVYGDKEEGVAYAVANSHIVASYSNKSELARFAHLVDVILLEFENVPTEALDHLAIFKKPVCPMSSVLAITQDRWYEKELCHQSKIKTAETVCIISEESIERLTEKDFPGRLKTRRFGYDGHGQVVVSSQEELLVAWEKMQSKETTPCIYEKNVDFFGEFSVIVARNSLGEKVALPVVKNVHENGILRTTTYDLNTEADSVQVKMEEIAYKLADKLKLVGLLAVEFFLKEREEILVNEMAPRPHNSGHWSIDGCNISQYEMYIRAACNLPMITPTPHSSAIMTNLLGEEVHVVKQSADDNLTFTHIYGKSQVKPGRKMGHVTRLLKAT